MGILDDLLAGAAGSSMGGGMQPRGGSGMSQALVALLPVVLSMLASGRSRGGIPGGGGGDSGGGMGGGLGDILGQMAGGRGSGGQGGGLGDVLGQVLGGGGGGGSGGGLGGLGGLLRQLEGGGLGEQSRSWVSTGPNARVTPDAIGGVFGPQALASIAQHAGISEQETRAGLAQLLPEVVDKVTPDGRVPDDNELDASLQSILRRLTG